MNWINKPSSYGASLPPLKTLPLSRINGLQMNCFLDTSALMSRGVFSSVSSISSISPSKNVFCYFKVPILPPIAPPPPEVTAELPSAANCIEVIALFGMPKATTAAADDIFEPGYCLVSSLFFADYFFPYFLSFGAVDVPPPTTTPAGDDY